MRKGEANPWQKLRRKRRKERCVREAKWFILEFIGKRAIWGLVSNNELS